MKTVILSVVLCATVANCFFLPSVNSVDELDITKYLGRWYEMYSSLIPRWTFQRDSYCTSATYTLEADGKTVKVFNAGRKSSATGLAFNATGTLTRPDPINAPGEGVVNFDASQGGYRKASSPNYLVVKLGPATFGEDGQYEYTIITSTAKALVWVLSRDPTVFKQKYEKEVLQYLKENGYKYFWNKPRASFQGPECVYPKM